MHHKLLFINRIAIPLFLATLLTSCFKTSIEKPEVRAIARWNALIAQDWEKAYSYETPAYRKTYTSEQYKNSYGAAVDWKEIELSDVKITDDIADINLTLSVLFSDSGTQMLIPTGFKERWLLKDNQWWHVKE
jgi:hypothetical protein